MLRTILYQSTPQTSFPSEADLKILESAWRHNAEMGVTGYLLRTRTRYFQVLEGSADVLDDLMELIDRDARHDALEILLDTQVTHRKFSNWAMGYHLITEDERDEFQGWQDTGDVFARSMIDYMEDLARKREAASPMHRAIT